MGDASTPEPIGILGVGLLGAAIADAIRKAGFDVIGFDADPRKCLGAGDAADVVRRCGTIFVALPTSRIAGDVFSGLIAHWRKDQVVLDATTGSPEDAAKFGEELSRRGVHYLDATVSGSSDQVRRRDAVVMAGGSVEVFQRSRPLLETFARSAYHLGPWGSGARMKLVTNLVLGLNRAVLAEGLAFGEALGFGPEILLEVLRDGACYSRVMDTKGEKMIRAEYTPQARLSQHLKDVRLILDEAGRTQCSTPLSELHRQLLETAEALGYGEADNAAIREAFRPRPATPRD